MPTASPSTTCSLIAALTLLPCSLSWGADVDDDFPLAKPPPVQEIDDIAPGTGAPPLTTTGYIPEGELPEPEVRIVDRGNAQVEEYRINGRLYMIRVIPQIGLPYYLVDTDGDGSYDQRTNDLSSPTVPMWVVYSW